jgi:hypothetical protein
MYVVRLGKLAIGPGKKLKMDLKIHEKRRYFLKGL